MIRPDMQQHEAGHECARLACQEYFGLLNSAKIIVLLRAFVSRLYTLG